MRIIDCCENRDAEGRIRLLDKVRGAHEYGPGWWADMDAQHRVAQLLSQCLGDEYVLITDFRLLESEVTLPMVLIGPPGVRVIYASPVLGDSCAKGADWLVSSVGWRRSEPGPLNLQSLVMSMTQDLRSCLQNRGFARTDVEPVLMFPDDCPHIQAAPEGAPVVFGDTVERFAADVQRCSPIMDGEEANSLVDALVSRRHMEDQAALATEPRREFEPPGPGPCPATVGESARAEPDAGRNPGSPEEIRVLVVDDSREVRDRIRRVLESAGGIAVVGEAADGLEAIESFARLRPDVVCMDDEMQEMDGLIATSIICLRHADARVFIHGSATDWMAIAVAGLAGALDFLVGPPSDAELIGTVRSIARKSEADRRATQGSVEDYLRRQPVERKVVVPRLFEFVIGAIQGLRAYVLLKLQIYESVAAGTFSREALSDAEACILSAGPQIHLYNANRAFQVAVHALRNVPACDLDEPRTRLWRAKREFEAAVDAGTFLPMTDLPVPEGMKSISELKRVLCHVEEAVSPGTSGSDPSTWGLSVEELSSTVRQWLLCAASELQRVVVEG